jgi:hypothetical protein
MLSTKWNGCRQEAEIEDQQIDSRHDMDNLQMNTCSESHPEMRSLVLCRIAAMKGRESECPSRHPSAQVTTLTGKSHQGSR